ncbi:MAG: TolC family protein [Flavobacteriales bacterium]|mgnify:FL=1
MRSSILSLALFGASVIQAQQAFTLREALDYGRVHSANMVIAANERRRADAQAQEAVSGYLPQVNGYGQLDDNLKRQTTILPAGVFSDRPTPVQFGTQYITNVNLQAEQVLVDVAQLNGIQASRPNQAMADIRSRQVEEQLVYDVAHTYAQAQTYREQVRLLDENLKQYDALVPILQLRLAKGVVQELDVDRVEVTRRNIASQRTVAQANYDLAVARLKRIIGMPISEPLELTEPQRTSENMRQPSATSFAPANLLSYQFDEQSVLMQSIDLRRKRNAFIPTLSAYGRVGTMAQGNDLGASFNSWYDFASIGLKLNVPVFSGLRRSSQIQQSRIALENARERQRDNILGFQLDYQNADTRLLASNANVESDESNLQLAQDVFANTNLKYQQGTASLSDLLNADYQLKEARNNWVTSHLNRIIALIDLEKAKGTLLDYAKTL